MFRIKTSRYDSTLDPQGSLEEDPIHLVGCCQAVTNDDHKGWTVAQTTTRQAWASIIPKRPENPAQNGGTTEMEDTN